MVGSSPSNAKPGASEAGRTMQVVRTPDAPGFGFDYSAAHTRPATPIIVIARAAMHYRH